MKKRDYESGMVIVEATIVFPITVVIVIVMFLLGNAYLQKARIEAMVSEYAIRGAAYCVDPSLEYIEENGKVPELHKVGIAPYRYFIGGMNNVENSIEKQLKQELDDMSAGLFAGMEPQGYNSGIKAKFNNYFMVSSFSIDLNYKIVFPIRLLFSDSDLEYKVSSHVQMPVSDTTEFIRNVNMVEDYMASTGLTEKIEKTIDEKIKQPLINLKDSLFKKK